ncbi:DUF2806 domain-containing protein [Colwellia sp. TT2012]|uniref:DUF2806 domain-containing protein n=1 Tax=Colwellia sp. TT2012 TaxID=1720342 RepID=UPI00070A06E7|nr:DUF2806 domain-containing protein [Colwellia sp. TT2012]
MIGEKLLLKMWETLTTEGVGTLISPWKVRREGKAQVDIRRDEMLMLAQTELDVQAIREGTKKMLPDHSLVCVNDSGKSETLNITSSEKIEPTIDFAMFANQVGLSVGIKSIQEEINLNKIIVFAEKELENDKVEVPNDNIDPDWFTRWRDNAQKVKSEELQQLWAKVLAGEVKSPGSYSLRTLEFIKNISQEEANLISKLAMYAMDGSVYIEKRLEDVGIDFTFLLEMDDLGVISGVKGGGLEYQLGTREKGHYTNSMIHRNKILIFSAPDEKILLKFKCYKVTKIGCEIFELGDFGADQLYLESIGKKAKSQGVNVKIADWVQTTKKYGNFFNPMEL